MASCACNTEKRLVTAMQFGQTRGPPDDLPGSQQYPAKVWGRRLFRNLVSAIIESFTIRHTVVCRLE